MSLSSAAREAKSGSVLRDEPMSRHTSWRVGGPADVYFRPASVPELRAFLRDLAPEEPLTWTGLGSNLLVRDGGIRGVVINTLNLRADIETLADGQIRVGSGVPCTRLARFCVRANLGPAAFFAGIPGTLGGALAMNAGAFGGETWDSVVRVETIDRAGNLHTRDATQYEVGYRQVRGHRGEWFLAAVLKFESDVAEGMQAIRDLVAKRRESQPIGQPSCGSVFRNPPGGFAAKLIEEAGLKGTHIGGAMVSTKHANFIVNTGHATAADIEQLIDVVRAKVSEATGISLELEARLVGEPLEKIRGA